MTMPTDDHMIHLRNCMYQYSRALYRSIKDLIDPYVTPAERLEYRREVLSHCEQTSFFVTTTSDTPKGCPMGQ